MPTRPIRTRAIAWLLLAGLACLPAGCMADDTGSYDDLLALWKEFREFQKPRVSGGVPDYTAAAMAAALQRAIEDALALCRPAADRGGALYDEMLVEGIAHTQRRFSWERTAAQYARYIA